MASAQDTGDHSTEAGKCHSCGGACCPISLNAKSLCTDCFTKSENQGSTESCKKSPSKGLDLKNSATSQCAAVPGSPGTRGSLSNLSITSPTDQSRPGSGASMIVNPAESSMSEITDRSLESTSAETPLSGPTSAADDLPTDQGTPGDSSADSSSAAQESTS